MNGKILEWLGGQFNTQAFKEVDGQKVRDPDNDVHRIILSRGQVIRFEKANAYGGTDRVTQLVLEEDAKEIMGRHPRLFRYAVDLEKIEYDKEVAESMSRQAGFLLGFVRDNAEAVADILREHLRGKPGRPPNPKE